MLEESRVNSRKTRTPERLRKNETPCPCEGADYTQRIGPCQFESGQQLRVRMGAPAHPMSTARKDGRAAATKWRQLKRSLSAASSSDDPNAQPAKRLGLGSWSAGGTIRAGQRSRKSVQVATATAGRFPPMR